MNHRTLSGTGAFLLAILSLPLGLAQNSDLKTQIRDFPPDLRQYTRSALPEDLAPGGKPAIEPASSIFIRDVVVSNTDKGLKNSNNSPNGEPSIAINPKNPKEIDILAFTSAWG